MKRIASLVATVFLGGLVASARSVSGQATAAPSGGRLYRQYCASCHGLDARGDGPDATLFAPPPADLRAGVLQRYGTSAVVRRVRDGRPPEVRLEPTRLRRRAQQVETLIAYLKRMPTTDWARARRGRRIFLDRCALCHGRYGRPGPTRPAGVRLPRDLSSGAVQRSLSDAALAVLVRHGGKGMPALTPRVGKAEVPPLVAFVRLLSPGHEIYAQYCAACHGDDGRGGSIRPGEGHSPKVTFDAGFVARHDPDQLRATIWHMVADAEPRMPHYAVTLSDAQARAIVEYLQSLK
jgi:mono/diheme cytochrome c family protein